MEFSLTFAPHTEALYKLIFNRIMKLRLLLFGLCLSAFAPAWGQGGVDVTTLLADTKTFIFSDNQSTVKGYIYEQMEGMTSCCGKDRIYLEVKIDPSGYVLSAKTLTGRNDCFMQSAVDIVKNIKWNTEEFKGGPRSVYFEIKPDISCDGGRVNEYTAIEIFNNELLNGTGTVTSAPVATAPQPSTPPATQPAATPEPTTPTPQPEPVAETPAPVATAPAEEPVAEESAAAPAEEPQEEAPVAVSTPPADEPVVVESVEALTEQPASPPGSMSRPEEPAVVSLTPTDPPRGQAAVPGEPRELTEEEKQAITDQEAERTRREEEIRQLKEEMARMREQEERVREDARMAAAQRQQEDPYAYTPPAGDEGDYAAGNNGGLFLDELPYEGEGNDQVGPGGEEPDPAASQQDRIRNDISRIDQQIRDLEQKNRDAENAIRQQMQDAERANREIVQLFEEKQRRESEAAELREQQELARIEEDRRRIERQRDEQTQEVQRLQDELARLQSDVQTRMQDLDRQEEEIEQIGMQRQQREQEIMLERALREKEQETELERVRLEKMNSGNLFASGGINASDVPIDFATAADSERYVYLLQQVEMLTSEVNTLRSQLGKEPLPQVDPNARTTTQTPTGGAAPSINPSFQTPGAKNAAENMSWDDIDFVDPTLTAEDYQIVPKPQPVVTPPARTSEAATPVMNNPAAPATQEPAGPNPADANYRPGRGYSSLTGGEHGNTSGPVMGPRPYVNGETALKELVKDNLESGGVCGLAHVIFSVTLKPDGSVLNYRVLSANSAQVQAQVGTIIPNLKFSSVDGRYNQTIYQEIKAEIVCSEN